MKMSRDPNPRELKALVQVLTVKGGFRSLGRIESEDDIDFWEEYSFNLGLTTFKHGTGRDRILLVHRGEIDIEKVIYHHFEARSGDGIDNNFLGDLYGYPKCCIAHFNDNSDIMIHSRDDELKLKTIYPLKEGIVSPYLNNFVGGFISHLVCSYRCGESLAIGKRNSEMIRSFSREFHNEAMKMVRGCLVLTDRKFFFVESPYLIYDKDKVRFRFPDGIESDETLDRFKVGDEYLIDIPDDRARTFIFDHA